MASALTRCAMVCKVDKHAVLRTTLHGTQNLQPHLLCKGMAGREGE